MRLTKQCYECKQQFRYAELIDYASPGSVTMHSYCAKCLKEKQSRDEFSKTVCSIFGLKVPGPRIWTERKRLYEKYGYTDETLIECLKYLYNVENKKKLAESLCLITPITVERMKKWQRRQQAMAAQLAAAATTETVENIVEIRENNNTDTIEYNPDDWLD